MFFLKLYQFDADTDYNLALIGSMTLKIFNLYRSALVILCIVVHNNMAQVILTAHIFIYIFAKRINK